MSVQYYRKICQKGELENYLFDQFVFRRISIYGTMAALRLRLKPNWITLASLVCSIASLYPLGTNDATLVVAGCLLVFLYNYLDHIDGELARFYHHQGKSPGGLGGQFFDVLCHSYSANLMLLFMAWASYSEHQQPWMLVLGVAAMAGVNGYPNLVAAKVVMIKVGADTASVHQPGMQNVLAVLEKKQVQINQVQSIGFNKSTLIKLAKETLGYPGILMIVIFASLLDLFTPPLSIGIATIDARIAALFVVAIVHLSFCVLNTRRWMTRLGAIR